MKIFLTGPAGFLGGYLLRNLLAQKHDVTIFTRPGSDMSNIDDLLSQVTVVENGQMSIDDIFASQSFDAVIHTLTDYGRGTSIADVFKSNAFLSFQLLESACRHGVPLWLNADTFLSKTVNPYALAKAQFREWGQYFSGMNKIRFVNVKMEYIVGLCAGVNRLHMYVLENCLNNVSSIDLTAGEQKRDFIDIRDVVQAYTILLNFDWSNTDFFQEVEVATGTSTSVRAFVELIHRLTESKTRLNFGALPYRANEAMDVKVDLSKMCSMGWSPTISLEKSIADLIASKKEQPCAI